MLQQDKPDDFVIATGETNSLEEFISEAFVAVGLNWRDHVIADPSLYRPTEISIGKGNPGKAARVLGWKAKYKMRDVVRMMVEYEQRVSMNAHR